MRDFDDVYKELCDECETEMESMKREAVRETLRKEVLQAVSLLLIYGGIIWLIVINSIFVLHNAILQFVIGLLVPILSIFVGVYVESISGGNTTKEDKYERMFKGKIIKRLLKEFSDDIKFYTNSDKKIMCEDYRNAQFGTFDNFYYRADDMIYGTLKNGSVINMVDCFVRENCADENKTGKSKDFFGLFAFIELKKNISTSILIRKDYYKKEKNKSTKIELDSSEFEKIYNVYSEDKVTTFQLITSDTMQMLIDFEKENGITPELTMYENKLYIRFETGKMFEPTYFEKKRALDYETLKKYYNTMCFTLKFTEKITKNIKETEI